MASTSKSADEREAQASKVNDKAKRLNQQGEHPRGQDYATTRDQVKNQTGQDGDRQ
jgi:hypothetical protein